MNTTRNATNNLINLDIISIMTLLLSLFLLSTIALGGSLAPVILHIFMIVIGVILITLFSNKNEIIFKMKLFVFFFSLYLVYSLINYYILLRFFPDMPPTVFHDETVFYNFSNLALPYISGEKNFFELFTFASYPLHEQPLHAMFSALIASFSIAIDGNNTIIVQKLLSPFFGGMFSVVLYSTLKYQFTDRAFVLNATFAYSLLSAVFMYSTPLLRDIDVALAYIVFIYIFLQPNSYKNIILLFIVAFLTVYLRTESGLVLFGLILLYGHLYVRTLESRSLKLIFYILLIGLFSFIIILMSQKIIGMIVSLTEGNTTRAIARSSADSISLIFNKLPFPFSYIAKVLFGQMQPFPFFIAMDRLPEAISGIFWPFIFIAMLYAVMKKNIRVLIDIKVKYLLIVAIAILFLMSSEPMARRMMSVYPIIYITSLYVFFIVPNNEIKRALSYYIFGIISLNTFYYLIKL
ncbi:hypothetical protein TSL6_09760 [Sulfurovum sp. TSL6]|uniref:hypothetical protein n=1 Tax=Sulfurovum sp. TSL6 TaxID=2826995 RepID=UPI001CC64462|nr:hypothetical protein [Sulfurovum sp. TSL6]GIU00470.1 hypothetical protein TSL6_09760 [Sulfurovum sp. TSL6]